MTNTEHYTAEGLKCSVNSQWEVLNVGIGEPGILQVADIETELFHHRPETGNTLQHVCGSELNLIVAAIAGKEFGNGQMSDTNCSIGAVVSI